MKQKLFWCILYAIICVSEFLLDKAKDAVKEKIWPDDDEDKDKPKDPDPEDGDDDE